MVSVYLGKDYIWGSGPVGMKCEGEQRELSAMFCELEKSLCCFLHFLRSGRRFLDVKHYLTSNTQLEITPRSFQSLEIVDRGSETHFKWLKNSRGYFSEITRGYFSEITPRSFQSLEIVDRGSETHFKWLKNSRGLFSTDFDYSRHSVFVSTCIISCSQKNMSEISKHWIYWVLNISNHTNFPSLGVVNRSNETQRQVTENLNRIVQYSSGDYLNIWMGNWLENVVSESIYYVQPLNYVCNNFSLNMLNGYNIHSVCVPYSFSCTLLAEQTKSQ